MAHDAWAVRFSIRQTMNTATVKGSVREGVRAHSLREFLPANAANNAAEAVKMLVSDDKYLNKEITVCSKTIGKRVYDWKVTRTD